MDVRRTLARWIAVAATTAVVGLGTFGLYHVYADALDGHSGHDCMTCRVVGSASALVVAKPAAALTTLVTTATVVTPSEIEHHGFTRIHTTRGPPFAS